MRKRNPMLTVAGEDQHEQGGEKCEGFAVGKDLLEHPPCRNADEETDDQREDLPIERHGRDQTGGEIKNGTEERAERHERRDELGGTEEFCDPGEGPVVPVEAGERKEQAVGADGDDRDQKGLARCRGGAELHPSIIRDSVFGQVIVRDALLGGKD